MTVKQELYRRKSLLNRKIIFLVIFLSLFAMNTPTVTAATIVDWGDVVNVVFSLYEDQGHIYPIVANDIT